MNENTKKVTLDGQEITFEQLQEKKAALQNDERIVEVSTNTYETISRMRG